MIIQWWKVILNVIILNCSTLCTIFRKQWSKVAIWEKGGSKLFSACYALRTKIQRASCKLCNTTIKIYQFSTETWLLDNKHPLMFEPIKVCGIIQPECCEPPGGEVESYQQMTLGKMAQFSREARVWSWKAEVNGTFNQKEHLLEGFLFMTCKKVNKLCSVTSFDIYWERKFLS